jgi:hypothetical protein
VVLVVVYWQAREISGILSQCDPLGNGNAFGYDCPEEAYSFALEELKRLVR